MYLVQFNKHIVNRFLRIKGTEMTKRFNRLDRLVGPIQLLHHNRHVLQRTVNSIPCIYCGPKQRYCLAWILLYQLHKQKNQVSIMGFSRKCENLKKFLYKRKEKNSSRKNSRNGNKNKLEFSHLNFFGSDIGRITGRNFVNRVKTIIIFHRRPSLTFRH